MSALPLPFLLSTALAGPASGAAARERPAAEIALSAAGGVHRGNAVTSGALTPFGLARGPRDGSEFRAEACVQADFAWEAGAVEGLLGLRFAVLTVGAAERPE